MSLTILNDLHIGVQRSAGTTPASQMALRRYLLDGLDDLLSKEHDSDVLVLGDLFDTNNIPALDLLETFQIFERHLQQAAEHKLYLVPGNHDLSKTSNVLSSFQLMAQLLEHIYPKQVIVVSQPSMLDHECYVIPHLPNQDLFNLALEQVPKQAKILFLHCNFDNNFAAQSDQSLNLSKEQAAELRSRGVEAIIIAHEHQPKRWEHVILPGNQLPSSVADWLGTDRKQYAKIMTGGNIALFHHLAAEGNFETMQWNELRESDAKFIRIEGTAQTTQAAEVIAAIARYRNKSSAFVVSNAVKIDSPDSSGEFAQALTSIKSFDVMKALKEILTAEEFAVIERLE